MMTFDERCHPETPWRTATVQAICPRRVAGYAYIARFEMVLDVLKRREYRLEPGYPQAAGVGAGVTMGRSVLSHALFPALLR